MIPLLYIENDLSDSDLVFQAGFFHVVDARTRAQEMSRETLSWMEVESESPYFERFCAQGERPAHIYRAAFGRGSLVILDYGV